MPRLNAISAATAGSIVRGEALDTLASCTRPDDVRRKGA